MMGEDFINEVGFANQNPEGKNVKSHSCVGLWMPLSEYSNVEWLFVNIE